MKGGRSPLNIYITIYVFLLRGKKTDWKSWRKVMEEYRLVPSNRYFCCLDVVLFFPPFLFTVVGKALALKLRRRRKWMVAWIAGGREKPSSLFLYIYIYMYKSAAAFA